MVAVRKDALPVRIFVSRAKEDPSDGISLYVDKQNHSSRAVPQPVAIRPLSEHDDSHDRATALDGLPPFLTVAQAGSVLQLGRSTAYELTALWERTDGATGLAFVWVGHQKRVPRAALEELIAGVLHRDAS